MNVCYNDATTRQNYGTATEKLAFEYDKSFSGAKTNLHKQNHPSMASRIKLATISYCTIYYLLYQEFLTLCVYPIYITGFPIVLAVP